MYTHVPFRTPEVFPGESDEMDMRVYINYLKMRFIDFDNPSKHARVRSLRLIKKSWKKFPYEAECVETMVEYKSFDQRQYFTFRRHPEFGVWGWFGLKPTTETVDWIACSSVTEFEPKGLFPDKLLWQIDIDDDCPLFLFQLAVLVQTINKRFPNRQRKDDDGFKLPACIMELVECYVKKTGGVPRSISPKTLFSRSREGGWRGKKIWNKYDIEDLYEDSLEGIREFKDTIRIYNRNDGGTIK